MEQNEFYEINGFVVQIPKDKYEFNNSYLERVLFIISKSYSKNCLYLSKSKYIGSLISLSVGSISKNTLKKI